MVFFSDKASRDDCWQLLRLLTPDAPSGMGSCLPAYIASSDRAGNMALAWDSSTSVSGNDWILERFDCCLAKSRIIVPGTTRLGTDDRRPVGKASSAAVSRNPSDETLSDVTDVLGESAWLKLDGKLNDGFTELSAWEDV